MVVAVPLVVFHEEIQTSMRPMVVTVTLVFPSSLKVRTRQVVLEVVSMDLPDAMDLPWNCLNGCHTSEVRLSTMWMIRLNSS